MYQDYYQEDIDYNIFNKDMFQIRYEDEGIILDPAIYMAHFRNLHKLILINMAVVDGYAEIWREALLHIFLNSPELRIVNLAKGRNYFEGDDNITEANSWSSMMDWICNNYYNKSGYGLYLEDLVLDDYIYFPETALKMGKS